MSKRAIIIVLSIVFLGAIITIPMLNKQKMEKQDHETDPPAQMPKGSHGGTLLSKENFQLEVTIFERGVPPQYRVYAYDNGKLIDPQSVNLKIELHRLGGRIDQFSFKKQQDYLLGRGVVKEPHSFDVKVTASYKDNNYNWEYPSYEGRTTMTSEGIKNAGIVIETAGPAKMKKVLELPGELILNPDKETHILPRFDGIVTKVQANLGDEVQKGQALATLESMQLAEEKSEYVEALYEHEFSKKAYEREEVLWNKKITSEQDYLAKKHEYDEAKLRLQTAIQKLKSIGISSEQVESSQNLSIHTIRAPIKGSVIEKDVASGEAVQSNEKIFVIADLSSLYAEVTISANQISVVREGQEVNIVSDVLSKEVKGRLTYVGPLVGEQTRSAKGRILISNADGSWRPGVFVKAFIVQEEVEVPLAVKASGLQTFRDWDVVFLAEGNTFEVRPLELGRRDSEWVEVLSGIAPGDRYVSENSFVVKADVEKSGAKHDH
jgi:cobalt-zinc-cadmium efflux system membrane fusion protein